MRPTRPFSGVSPGVTVPLGQVSLTVTFDTKDNYQTEIIMFNIVDIDLSYNDILGRPALAKFMIEAH